MKILLASRISAEAIKELQERHDVISAFDSDSKLLGQLLTDREALVFRSGVEINREIMCSAPNLRLLIRAGSGTDNLDLDYVRKKRLHLVRIPEPGAKAVAEMAFALMLALSRNLLEADRLTRRGDWAKQQLTGYLLWGKTLGVVGAGNIGSRVGELGAAWGMHVLGCTEHTDQLQSDRLLQKGIRLASLREVLSASDYISLHLPLQPSTRYLIGEQALGMMKPEAVLINLARGGVVNEAALLSALQRKQLRGAALDVHESEGQGRISPLASLPNVLLTPHIGAGTFDSQREIGERILQIVESWCSREGKDQEEAHVLTETGIAEVPGFRNLTRM